MVEVVQELGSDFGKGLSWANDKIDKLKNVKLYLKRDYKVITIICALFESVNTIIRCGTKRTFISRESECVYNSV